MPPQDIVAATDIGTHKVVVLVAKCVAGQPLQVIGKSEKLILDPEDAGKRVKTPAMLRGRIMEEAVVSDVFHSALEAAEREAEKRVGSTRLLSTYLSLTGGGLVGTRCSGNANVRAASRLVSEDDCRRALTEARKIEFGPGLTPVVRIRQPFFLDGRMCSSPVGQMGEQLKASFWTIGAPPNQIDTLVQMAQGLNLRVNEFIVSSAASGAVLAGEHERENGVLIVDIGAGTTDYILYRKGAVLATGVLPVGGDHVTNDLYIGLRLQSRKIAEKIKREHDPAILAEDKDSMIATHGDNAVGDKRIRVLAVEQIIRARLAEVFDIIKKRLSPNVERGRLVSGVILTGGTSQLRGIGEIAEEVLRIDVHPGEFASWVPSELAFPQYSTVLGVLYDGWVQVNKLLRPPPPPRHRPRKARRTLWQTIASALSQ